MNLSLFTEFGLILVLAAGVALIMRILKQPLIIGHIITGLIVGPLVLNIIHSSDIFKLFSEIGIAFLLFSVGLNLNPKVLKDYGKVALITGIGQVVFTTLAGLVICIMLGFSFIPALYISVALAFSSTIIILKLLSDRGDLDTLYAKISIGFLLVQDLIAIILLFSVPLISAGNGSSMEIVKVFGVAVVVSGLIFAFAYYILRNIHGYLSRSQELLFLFATAWGIGIAVIFKEIGFSLETGALIAGVALSLLPSRHEINARLTPLRDFFIVIFFILLGSNITFAGLSNVIYPALILSLLVLILNPLIMMIIMGLLGYRRKTSLQTGFTVAQISEFSLILITLGVSLGHISPEVLSMVTLVALITIFGSSYLILYSDFWYRILGPYLKIFERKKILEKKKVIKEYEVLLFGGNRIGFDFIQTFKNTKKLLVIDHDPEAVSQLQKEGVDCVLGDAGNIDFLDSLNFSKTELIISTIPLVEVNQLIMNVGRRHSSSVIFMAVAHSITNALMLYNDGASYVILPHFLGGTHASNIAHKVIEKIEDIAHIKAEHISHLEHRANLGHEHPIVEHYR